MRANVTREEREFLSEYNKQSEPQGPGGGGTGPKVWESVITETRGGSLRAELVIPLALRRKGGGTLPRDFIRFSRCQFCRVPVRSGFERVFAHGRDVATADGQSFSRM